MNKKTITLIRHAQSAANAGYATNDHATIPLTDLGYTQAAELPSKLKTSPDLIIVSPFLRAKETAKPLINTFANIPVEELFLIHEMNNLAPHKCENMTPLERKPFIENYWSMCDPYYIDGYGAESFATFIKRVESFIKILETKTENNIIVVGHGRFFQAVLYCISINSFVPTEEMMKNFIPFFNNNFIANTEMIELRFKQNKWLLWK